MLKFAQLFGRAESELRVFLFNINERGNKIENAGFCSLGLGLKNKVCLRVLNLIFK